MSKPAIEVRGLSKKFIINHKNKASYSTIKEEVGNMGRRLIGRDVSTTEEEFWALKDVSFDVPQGEIFGVIGKNGSGKSTLLKTLSRIISPTEGEIKLRGKVASLLEVGTGFHPELTGRENVYFNGSMLGMKRSEITRKFQEIVDFSEIEKFIDTPVKFYSSGMYVRLAFAVAAHLDPEILILDEVLAVGDANFQKKSMNKILSTMREGRTVLFVSHNVGVIRQLCTNGILLNQGQVEAKGKIADIIDQYMLDNQQIDDAKIRSIKPTWTNNGKNLLPNPYLEILSLTTVDENYHGTLGKLDNSKDYYLKMDVDIKKLEHDLSIGYVIWDEDGRNIIYQSHSSDSNRTNWLNLNMGHHSVYARIPKYLLNEGRFRVSIVASLYAREWIYDTDSTPIKIELTIKHGQRDMDGWTEPRGGYIAPIIDWHKK